MRESTPSPCRLAHRTCPAQRDSATRGSAPRALQQEDIRRLPMRANFTPHHSLATSNTAAAMTAPPIMPAVPNRNICEGADGRGVTHSIRVTTAPPSAPPHTHTHLVPHFAHGLVIRLRQRPLQVSRPRQRPRHYGGSAKWIRENRVSRDPSVMDTVCAAADLCGCSSASARALALEYTRKLATKVQGGLGKVRAWALACARPRGGRGWPHASPGALGVSASLRACGWESLLRSHATQDAAAAPAACLQLACRCVQWPGPGGGPAKLWARNRGRSAGRATGASFDRAALERVCGIPRLRYAAFATRVGNLLGVCCDDRAFGMASQVWCAVFDVPPVQRVPFIPFAGSAVRC